MAEFPPEIIAAAQAAERKYPDGPPAAVSLAQWAEESGFGQHMPEGSNNPFGIKARAGEPFVLAWTHEEHDGRYVRLEAKFRKFTSIEEAFDRHAELLSRSLYYQAQQADTDEDYADALTGIYASDEKYGAKLRRIMDEYNLYRYDVG